MRSHTRLDEISLRFVSILAGEIAEASPSRGIEMHSGSPHLPVSAGRSHLVNYTRSKSEANYLIPTAPGREWSEEAILYLLNLIQ